MQTCSRTLLALAVIAGIVGISACGEEDSSVTSDRSPQRFEQVCFEAQPLVVAGGKGLASIRAGEVGRPADHGELRRIARLAFEPSLRGSELRRLKQSDGDPGPVIAAAEEALAKVRVRPELLLDEAALTRAFAEAQRLAAQGGYSSPDCGDRR